MENPISLRDLRKIPYREAWEIQELLRGERAKGAIPDTMLLLEHDPVFTLGKRDCSGDFISSADDVKKDGIEIVQCNRGGRITYHGPGQLVCYFIFDLPAMGMGVKDFVRSVEVVCMEALSECGVEASRDDQHPGLWMGRDKIVAIGLNVAHGITEHGFAMNVDCDLSPYRHIVACGIKERGVTSMKNILGEKCPTVDIMKKICTAAASRVFGRAVLKN
jgi:lipoate-protein ligase B